MSRSSITFPFFYNTHVSCFEISPLIGQFPCVAFCTTYVYHIRIDIWTKWQQHHRYPYHPAPTFLWFALLFIIARFDFLTQRLINPLRAKCFRGNINIYLHFLSYLHIHTTQVVKILPQNKTRIYLFYIVNIMADDVISSHDIDLVKPR